MEPVRTGYENRDTQGGTMNDELKHKAEGALGKGKEKLGDASDDPDLKAEGKTDQSKADLKQAGDKVKDAFKS